MRHSAGRDTLELEDGSKSVEHQVEDGWDWRESQAPSSYPAARGDKAVGLATEVYGETGDEVPLSPSRSERKMEIVATMVCGKSEDEEDV